MTADEKALLKQMKQAYASKDGYTLSVEDIVGWDGSPWVGIITDGWGMACTLDTLPRKVLGLIAEHIGEIPGPGCTYHVQKKQIHRKIFEPLPKLKDGVPTGAEIMRRTPLQVAGMSLWQSSISQTFAIVESEKEELIQWSRVPGQWLWLIGGMLWMQDIESLIYVSTASTKEMEELSSALDHLAQYRWVPDD